MYKFRIRRWLALLALILVGGCNDKKTTLNPSVLTQHNDERRSGVQLETTLNTSNVRPGSFGKLFTHTLKNSPNSTIGVTHLKDRIYTQPLVVGNVSPALVIVATDTNMVYAFNAEDDKAVDPVWSADLDPPEIAIFNWGGARCNRSLPIIGVLSTPVITPDEQSLYVVSTNRLTDDVSSTFVGFRIHKLEVKTGRQLAGSALPLNVDFVNYLHLQRAGLGWVPNSNAPGGGYVYAGFGGHCDVGSDSKNPPVFHGWIIGFDGNLKKQVAAFNTTPDGWGGGIWQAGQALVYDRNQNKLYVSTGNGEGKYANSVLALLVNADGSLTVADQFRPYNWEAINNCDADIGSTGPVLIINRYLVVGGKEGVLYILDTNLWGKGVAQDTQANLDGTKNQDFCQHTGGGGGFNTGYIWNPHGDDVFQEFVAVKSHQLKTEQVFGHIHGGPVYATLSGKLWLYVWPEMDNLKQFEQVQGGKFNTIAKESNVGSFEGMPGGMLSISSSAGGGDDEVIVWATHPKEDAWTPAPLGTWQSIPKPVDGILYAFDARDITTPLWSSDMRQQDKLGEFSKFAPPTIWNARVYVATFSGELQVYGLCGKPTPCE